MDLSCSSDWDLTMALGSSSGYSDLHGPGCIMALGHQHGLSLSLVAIWAMDFNTDPGCGRTTDPDIIPSISLGLDVTMAPGSGNLTKSRAPNAVSLCSAETQSHRQTFVFKGLPKVAFCRKGLVPCIAVKIQERNGQM
ncbi:hypothetical protein STEG23_013984, partial [Scotinomys teguina]